MPRALVIKPDGSHFYLRYAESDIDTLKEYGCSMTGFQIPPYVYVFNYSGQSTGEFNVEGSDVMGQDNVNQIRGDFVVTKYLDGLPMDVSYEEFSRIRNSQRRWSFCSIL